MTVKRETLDWLLKASLWISAGESLEDTFQALRSAKNDIRDNEQKILNSNLRDESVIYRLIESEVWTASGRYLSGVSANLIEIFSSFRPKEFGLNEQLNHFEETLYECRVKPMDELSDFWNLRVESAKERGADASEHSLLDYALKTVEIGVHPINPDPVSFIVGSFSDDDEVENPDGEFTIDIQHRSAKVSLSSNQFESIHKQVVWINDSSGRMGVVGGEPLPVIGQPEGNEPALRFNSNGEQMLQPFDEISLLDEDVGFDG